MASFEEIKSGFVQYDEPEKGWVAFIKGPVELLKAAAKVRDAAVKQFDCFTPFPIHGLDEAMGLKRSWITFVTLVMAITGVTAGLSYISYIDVFNWPIRYGGKPFFALPAYIAILFELAILFGAIGTVACVILLGKLNKPFREPLDLDLTSDKFALWIGDDITEDKAREILSGIEIDLKSVEDIRKEQT